MTLAHALFFPPAASERARGVDLDTLVLLALSTVVMLTVAGLVLWFGVRYREGAPRPADPRRPGSMGVEIGWTIAITIGGIALFVLGARSVLLPGQPPAGGETIYVVGKQWMWKIQHPDGRREINRLHVPAGEPVRLLLTSQDAIHSFFIPAFRIKQDALPGRFTSLQFIPTRTGTYDLYCAEYCGSKHSNMIGSVVVMNPAEYQQWLDSGDRTADSRSYIPLARDGAAAFTRFGCAACHGPRSTDTAPRLDGLYNRQTRTNAGEIIIADENYLRESILRPDARIVAGYTSPSLMPSYSGQITEQDLIALIEFIRSIRHGWPDRSGSDPQTPDPDKEPTP